MAKQAAARRINGVVGNNGSITPSTPRAIESQPALINRILIVWCFISFALLQEIITGGSAGLYLSLHEFCTITFVCGLSYNKLF